MTLAQIRDISEAVMALLGAVGTVLTVGAAVLPKAWKFTAVLARFGSDLTGVGKHHEAKAVAVESERVRIRRVDVGEP